jgi:phenol 2-monooxygenase
MQFHLNGYKPGDPDIADPAERTQSHGATGLIPDFVDVLIVGCGPAGLTLAAQLAAFGTIKTVIVDQKSGRLLRGQADGIACRSVEVFNAFGFAEKLLREAYWVNETSFWNPADTAKDRICRAGRIEDVEEGLSEFPHVILNQARVHDHLLDVMRKSAGKIEPYYSRKLVDLTVDRNARDEHPVAVSLQRVDAAGKPQGEAEIVRARYVVGCDGARSTVRRLLGRELRGDSANQAWGVMDVLAVSDFPDIRLKAVIQSADEGSIVLIPREGGYLTRIYVELDKLADNERAASRDITIEQLIAAAQRIFNPYALDVKDVVWWSVYEIGQRLTDKFDDVDDVTLTPRVFIAGDACHTHSPKAGQGMNVSIQDAFNLGWKLAGVLRRRHAPEILHSYSDERQSVAKQLIDFDREWTTLLAAPRRSSENPTGVDPSEVQRFFVQHGRYTAGTATRYTSSDLTSQGRYQHLAPGFAVGTRFHSAPVIRLADAKPMELGHTLTADGRWRLLVFCGPQDPTDPSAPIAKFGQYLTSSESSPLGMYTAVGEDCDAVIDVRAIFQQPHRSIAVQDAPPFLLPLKGQLGLRDYEKMFCPCAEANRDIFTMRGVDRTHGCIVVVRPDQFVADVLPLDAHDELEDFFRPIMLSRAS